MGKRIPVAEEFDALERRYSLQQVAKMLGVSAPTVASWLDSGELIGFRSIGGKARIRGADVIDFCRRMDRRVPAQLRREGKKR